MAVVNGGTPSPDEANWGGEIPWATPVDLNACNGGYIGETLRTLTRDGLRSGSKSVPAGSVLLSTRAPIGYVAVTREEVSFNQGCKGLTPVRGKVSSKFLMYLISASKEELWALGQGTTFPELSGSALGGVKLCVPLLTEQLEIAAYLDHETIEIDAFIADQEELIALLNERRSATITQAVTKGLDLTVQMKDSGIEWLGKIPKHWTLDKVSRAFRAFKGKRAAQLTKEYCADNPGEFPVYSGQTENEGIMGVIDSFEFDAGDDGVLFATTVGAKAMSAKHITGCFSLSQNCMIIVPKVPLNVRFYLYLFHVLFSYEKALIPQHMQASFRMEDLYNYRFPALGIKEQEQISAYLDRECSEIDAAIADAKEAIELSKERRAALISAAVTGKIDVRNHITAELGAA